MKARVTLQRPTKAAPEPIGTPVADSPPPPPAPDTRGKPWRALRAGRPKLLEPLPEGDIWVWKRQASMAVAILAAVLSVLGTWAGILPHRHYSGVDCARCDDR